VADWGGQPALLPFNKHKGDQMHYTLTLLYSRSCGWHFWLWRAL